MAVSDQVKKIIVEQLGVDEEEVTPDASFVDDLGADSLDTVELVMAFEEEFGIEIPDEDAEKITRVKEAIEYIEGLIEQSGGFGTFLMLGHDWASPERTMNCYRLFAREVIPHFQGHLSAANVSHEWATAKRGELFGRAGQAMMNAITSHVEEKAVTNGKGASS